MISKSLSESKTFLVHISKYAHNPYTKNVLKHFKYAALYNFKHYFKY